MPFTAQYENESHERIQLIPHNIIDACLIVTGTQGGTWAQHENQLVWQKAFWKPRPGMEYRWVLLHKRAASLAGQGNIVASWCGKSRNDTPPAISADMASKVTVARYIYYPSETLAIDHLPHDARKAIRPLSQE